jgi:hypothetical protein
MSTPSDPITFTLSLPAVIGLGTLLVLGALSCLLTIVESIHEWRERRRWHRMCRQWAAAEAVREHGPDVPDHLRVWH